MSIANNVDCQTLSTFTIFVNSFISEKQEETRDAIDDLDGMVGQIKKHQKVTNLNNLRKLRYYLEMDGTGSDIYANYKKGTKSPEKAPQIDRREVDKMIEDALKHANKMMAIIKELNQALDEFEEQFNLPRFEPNNIESAGDSRELF